jgi:hypothetical protein
MMIRSRLRLGPLATPLRHCVAAIAMFAQLVMAIAPIADLQDAAPLTPTIASIVEMGNTHTAFDTDHGHQHNHDASTCPACIAQSLVAQVASPTRALLHVGDEHATAVVTTELPLQAHYLSLQRSRAPPTAS